MLHYYLDIGTTGLDENNDEIITIQYQKISVTPGEPIGPLIILKSWEYGEKNIVKEIAVMILVNGGKLKGCNLVLEKKGGGANIPNWHNEGRFDLIEEYIKDETTCFLEFVSKAQQVLGIEFGLE